MRESDPIAAELKAVTDLPDSKIDTSDIPEVVDWSGGVRGRFNPERASSTAAARMTRMSKEQKAEIRRLLRQAIPREEIAAKLSVTPGQVSAVKAHVAMGTYDPEAGESEEVLEAFETTFGLERDSQRALRQNIDQLEPGLVIVDEQRERRVNWGGFVDITARDKSGALVVIELKAGIADRNAVGQTLAYMGDLMDQAASVRGILIASDFHPSALAAAKAARNIRLMRYGVRFSFADVPLAGAST
jgi:Endonuclease NucS